MKRKTTLVLARETVRELRSDTLRAAAGGVLRSILVDCGPPPSPMGQGNNNA